MLVAGLDRTFKSGRQRKRQVGLVGLAGAYGLQDGFDGVPVVLSRPGGFPAAKRKSIALHLSVAVGLPGQAKYGQRAITLTHAQRIVKCRSRLVGQETHRVGAVFCGFLDLMDQRQDLIEVLRHQQALELRKGQPLPRNERMAKVDPGLEIGWVHEDAGWLPVV